MMDQSEFNQRVNMGGTGIEPWRCEFLLSGLTQKYEKDTRRLWKFRTLQTMQWEPEHTDQSLWFLGCPVLNNSNFNLLEWDLADRFIDAVPVHSGAYLMNWTEGEIQKVRIRRWSQIVQATYDCGYTTAQLPEYVKEGLVQQARYQNARWSVNKIDLKSHSLKGSSASLLEDVQHPVYAEAVRLGMRHVYGNTGTVMSTVGPQPNYGKFNASGFDLTGVDFTNQGTV